MKTHTSSSNDGTVAISNQFAFPIQGTFIATSSEGKKVCAKGIGRPLLRNPATNDIEEESCVSEAAFGMSISDAPLGEFFKLNALNSEACRIAYQTILFSAKDPAAFILEDSQRFLEMTALDLLNTSDKRKVKTGVPPSLLMSEMAPWDLLRRFEVSGVRATVFGSELVPQGLNVPRYKFGSTFSDLIQSAYDSIEADWKYSCFMMLPKSAEVLAKQLGCNIYDMIGRWFLIHRDPALPDGTSLVPMQFAGVLIWDKEGPNNHGIVLHPQDPYWHSAGGDFDGDSASVYTPSANFLPRGSLSRYALRLDKPVPRIGTIEEQMMAAADNSVGELLGPIILGAMRLIERGADSDDIRIAASSAAQASVESKKHIVDEETTVAMATKIFDAVRLYSEDNTYPYVSDFTNALRNASGVQQKLDAWNDLIRILPLWESQGTNIEKALCIRVRALHQLFRDTEFFRMQQNASLPSSLRETAKHECSYTARDAVLEVSEQYRALARQLGEESFEEDISVYESYRASLRDEMRSIRELFRLATITGKLGSVQLDAHDASIAIVAYGPAKLAARIVSPEIFEELGAKTSRTILNLIGHGYTNKSYLVSDINPIPAYKAEFDAFIAGFDKVIVEVIHKAPQSTRVLLTLES